MAAKSLSKDVEERKMAALSDTATDLNVILTGVGVQLSVEAGVEVAVALHKLYVRAAKDGLEQMIAVGRGELR